MAEVISATNRAAATISAPSTRSSSLRPRLLTHGEQTSSLPPSSLDRLEQAAERRELRRGHRLGDALLDEQAAVALKAHHDVDVRRDGGTRHRERDGRELRLFRAVRDHDHELLLDCHRLRLLSLAHEEDEERRLPRASRAARCRCSPPRRGCRRSSRDRWRGASAPGRARGPCTAFAVLITGIGQSSPRASSSCVASICDLGHRVS